MGVGSAEMHNFHLEDKQHKTWPGTSYPYQGVHAFLQPFQVNTGIVRYNGYDHLVLHSSLFINHPTTSCMTLHNFST